MTNRLDRETSPYLLQHADNPVHWRGWAADALDLAKSEDKPILLSVGYAACHWCHVMAHESFENPDIAAVMNEHFVNIKVDREERPDLDSIYQNALMIMGQQGGWPLTMFLTPEGAPFWGGTYFPPDARFGRPGFKQVLLAIAGHYLEQGDKVAESAQNVRAALKRLEDSKPGGLIPIDFNDQAAERLLQQMDMELGGIGSAPKFPNPSILELLWRGYRRTGNADMRDAVTLALDRMSQGGIYDHLGGGFARYSTDAAWLVPHFEKMLYDNAQLIDLLRWAWLDTRNPLYEARIRETIGWVLREMMAEGGGFAATLDADSEGEEGKFYVWTAGEIEAVLGGDAPLFMKAYDVTPTGNWEGNTILNRNHAAGPFTPEEETTLGDCRERLLAHRAGRVRPGWDDKVLADWNGLMIAAMIQAADTFDIPEWMEAARGTARFVIETMQEDGRLKHSLRNGLLKHVASLDDYANMCRAVLALYESTGEANYLAQAQHWVDILNRHYWDEIAGGYFFTADDAETLIVRTKHAHDNATPAGNGVMTGVLARLYYLTGDDVYRRRAEALISAFAGEISGNFFPLATLMNGAELLDHAVQVTIIGERDEPATRALLAAAFAAPSVNRLITVYPPDAALPQNHPALGKSQQNFQPTAYVCVGQSCTLPLTSADALREAIESPQTIGANNT